MQCERNLGQRSQAQIWSSSAARPDALELIRQPEKQPILAPDRLGLDLREDRNLGRPACPTGGWYKTANLDTGVRVLEGPRPGSTARACRGASACYPHPATQETIRLERFPNADQRRLIGPDRHGSTGGEAGDFFTRGITGRRRSHSGSRVVDRSGVAWILCRPAPRATGAQGESQADGSSGEERLQTRKTALPTRRHAGFCAS